jgi:membrane protease YdiL (CAAX protease family)
VLFASAHIPNPVLVVATLAVGICFTQLFRRYRNIWGLGIAHGLLGLALTLSVPNDVHHHMRVGIGYLRYHPSPNTPAPPILGLPHR